MPLLVQHFLRQHRNPEQGVSDLKSLYGINCSRSERNPGLCLFKYDQIESPMNESIVQECRGLILDSKSNWHIVAHPFHKFFNHGEQHAATIDWKTAKVQEKLDGSLMILYCYDGSWHVATSGNPDAAGNVNDFQMSFRSLFWDTWDRMGLPLDMCEPGLTYMFELTSQYNKVVVPHTKPRLTLLGVRDLESGEEDDPAYYTLFPNVKNFKLTSLDSIIESFNHIDGKMQEGYVVVDAQYNRIKVKHPQYVALHHLRDSVSGGPKSMVRLLQTNESDEFLVYFPEFRPLYEDVKKRMEDWTAGIEEEFSAIQEQAGADRKQFASLALKTRIPGYLFSKLDGKVGTVKEYISKLPVDNVMRALSLK